MDWEGGSSSGCGQFVCGVTLILFEKIDLGPVDRRQINCLPSHCVSNGTLGMPAVIVLEESFGSAGQAIPLAGLGPAGMHDEGEGNRQNDEQSDTQHYPQFPLRVGRTCALDKRRDAFERDRESRTKGIVHSACQGSYTAGDNCK